MLFMKLSFIVGVSIIVVNMLSKVFETKEDKEQSEADMNEIIDTVSSSDFEAGEQFSSVYKVFNKYPFLAYILTYCLGFIPIINVIVLGLELNGLKDRLIKKLHRN